MIGNIPSIGIARFPIGTDKNSESANEQVLVGKIVIILATVKSKSTKLVCSNPDFRIRNPGFNPGFSHVGSVM